MGWVLAGFALGIALSGSYGYTLMQKDGLVKTPSSAPAKELVATATVKAVVAQTEEVAPKKIVATEVETINKPVTAKQNEKLIPVVAEQASQWVAVGEEFVVSNSASATPTPLVTNATVEMTELSDYERAVIENTISSWAESWSKQNLSDYFYHYSDSYVPEMGGSYQEWLQTRKSRLLRPGWIKVDVSDIKLRRLAKNRVQVKFQQNFESSTYSDQINKSINMINGADGWKILTERSLGRIVVVAKG